MLKTIVATIALTLSLSAGSAFAAEKMLADRHAERGLECASCHKTAPVEGAVVRKDACKACHKYEDLAKKTEKLPQNPHYNHLGDVSCTDCHKGHQKPVMMCNDCHNFKMMPK